MRYVCFLLILTTLQNCSFDKNSGIWKSESNTLDDKNIQFKDFKTLISPEESFNEIVSLDSNFKFNLPKEIKNKEWSDIFFNYNNNFKNFQYSSLYKLISKSKKISKNINNNYLLFENKNIITSDKKGDLIVFSLDANKIISRFNFYKKNFKKIEKNLNLIVEKNIIYVSDNIGYLYAYNYKINKIVWAKNYKIPFSGNLKVSDDRLIASNQKNNLFFFNIYNGDILKLIPTEETSLNNQFKNNISLDDNKLIFLNAFGSLYSINVKNFKINWFVNLNPLSNTYAKGLFYGSEIINEKNRIIVSSNYFTYVINSNNGKITNKVNISTILKPIALDNYLFLISKKDLLILMDLNNGDIIFSSDINQNISDFLDEKKYKVAIKKIEIINNNIYIFLKNSYYLRYNLSGKLEYIKRLPSQMNSDPIFVNNSIYFLDFKNKLSIID